MARNAGFAFVASFSEALVNRVAQTYYANLASLYSFSLPAVITVSGVNVAITGPLTLLPPQITLQARPDDKITVWIGFYGNLQFTGAAAPASYPVIIGVTVDVAVAQTIVNDPGGSIIGLRPDYSAVTPTAIEIIKPQSGSMDPTYQASLQSPQAQAAVAAAIDSIPPDQIPTLTPQTLKVPTTYTVPYQPPAAAPVANPRPMFTLPFDIQRIVVRPVDAATPGPGALVVGIDLLEPSFTSGDPTALVDLNTVGAPSGNLLQIDQAGARVGTVQLFGAHNTDFACAVNADVLTTAVAQQISPQVSQKFITDSVFYAEPQINQGESPTYDCLTLSFDSFTAPLSDTWIDGLTIVAHVTDCLDTEYAGGYPYCNEGGPDAVVTINVEYLLKTFSKPPPNYIPPKGPALANVTFTTDPAGGYIAVDGGLFQGSVLQLTLGTHTVAANPGAFKSWVVSPPTVTIDQTGSATATLTVTGDGMLTLNSTMWDPFISQDAWTVAVPSVNIDLPAWVSFVQFLAGLTYFVSWLHALVLDTVGSDFMQGTLVDSVEQTISTDLVTSINGQLASLPVVGKLQSGVRLPGTTTPDFLLTMYDVVASSEGIESYVKLGPMPPNFVAGNPGNFPYLLLTDNIVTNPADLAESPGVDRIDGEFNWPGLTWNEDESNGSSLPNWDVHNFRPMTLVLKIPDGLIHPQDPTVTVRWQVQCTDTGEMLLDQSQSIVSGTTPVSGSRWSVKAVPISGGGGATSGGSGLSVKAVPTTPAAGSGILTPGPLVVTIDHASSQLQSVAGFMVTCSLSRILAGGETTIFSCIVPLPVEDHFNRRHPYVQWSGYPKAFYAGIPFWNAIPGAEHDSATRRWTRDVRDSRIHRTDCWAGGQRCLVSDTSGFGNHLGRKLKNSNLHDKNAKFRTLDFPWVYLDSLPVSLEEVARDRELARGILCDYCFFGGPTRTVLRTDFAAQDPSRIYLGPLRPGAAKRTPSRSGS